MTLHGRSYATIYVTYSSKAQELATSVKQESFVLPTEISGTKSMKQRKQVAQWATIAHLRASMPRKAFVSTTVGR